MAAPNVSAPVVRNGGIELTFTPPLKFIGKQTGAFARGLGNLGPLWNRLVPIVVDIETQQFADAGRANPWRPLKQETIDEKLRQGYPADILIRTGDLRRSLIDPGQAKETGPNYLAWSTAIPYAGFHQEGAPPRLPKREPIDITVTDRRRFEAAIVGWINTVRAATWRS